MGTFGDGLATFAAPDELSETLDAAILDKTIRQPELRHGKIQPNHLLSSRDWRKLRQWYHAHGRCFLPWRVKPNPWSVLLAETLLHRTHAHIVANVYDTAIRQFTSASDVLLNKRAWISITRVLGLSWRAETFIAACTVLTKRYGGVVPPDKSSLVELPGVGHYAASAVRCFGFENAGIYHGYEHNTFSSTNFRAAPGKHKAPKQPNSKRRSWFGRTPFSALARRQLCFA